MTNNQQPTTNKGFTLIELMVAISVFIVIMTISMGSILNVLDSNRKSRSLKTVINNLNLAVESMSKEMRYGKNYHCGASGDIEVVQNCSGGGTLLGFLSSDDVVITYRLNNNAIEKYIDDDPAGFVAVTAPEIVIDDLTFYTVGAVIGDSFQPKIIMKIESHSGSGRSRSDFTIETLISQRTLDI